MLVAYAARYRTAYESFAQTLAQAGRDAAGLGAASVAFGFATSILVAVASVRLAG